MVVWKHFLSTDNLEKFYFIDYDTDDGRKIEMGPSNTIHIVFGFSPKIDSIRRNGHIST